MAKVKNTAAGVYADGALYVSPGEVIEVDEAKAAYLCDPANPGSFERVKDEKPAAPKKDAK